MAASQSNNVSLGRSLNCLFSCRPKVMFSCITGAQEGTAKIWTCPPPFLKIPGSAPKSCHLPHLIPPPLPYLFASPPPLHLPHFTPPPPPASYTHLPHLIPAPQTHSLPPPPLPNTFPPSPPPLPNTLPPSPPPSPVPQDVRIKDLYTYSRWCKAQP